MAEEEEVRGEEAIIREAGNKARITVEIQKALKEGKEGDGEHPGGQGRLRLPAPAVSGLKTRQRHRQEQIMRAGTQVRFTKEVGVGPMSCTNHEFVFYTLVL